MAHAPNHDKAGPPSWWLPLLISLLGLLSILFGALVQTTPQLQRVLIYSGAALWLTAAGGAATGKYGPFSVTGAVGVLALLFFLNPDEVKTPQRELKVSHEALFEKLSNLEARSKTRMLYMKMARPDNEAYFLLDDDSLASDTIRLRTVLADGKERSLRLCVSALQAAMAEQEARNTMLSVNYIDLSDSAALMYANQPLTHPQSCPTLQTADQAEGPWWSRLAVLEQLVATAHAQAGFATQRVPCSPQDAGSAQLFEDLGSDNGGLRFEAAGRFAAGCDAASLRDLMDHGATVGAEGNYGGAVLDIMETMVQMGVPAQELTQSLDDAAYDYFGALYQAGDDTLARGTAAALTELKDPRAASALLEAAQAQGVPESALRETARAVAAGFFAADPETQVALTDQIQAPETPENLRAALGHLTAKAEDTTGDGVSTGGGLTDPGAGADTAWIPAWSSDPALQAAQAGDIVTLQSQTLLEEQPTFFSAEEGWVQAPVVGVVPQGGAITILESVESTPGFNWLRIER
ncbi:hypothetical protein [Pseudooceanicola sp. HF7]|uniref:hypothetical protein n=1 Tax=Pseudooceanicola sp. HF7 TaxID=2721560 RepID=UPI001430C3CF|nr:hypothetical protein [Pseudooceanicola sp. HF7]NIZ09709.1 hypothetical protein [Pseudooceanicola sp. HF7]